MAFPIVTDAPEVDIYFVDGGGAPVPDDSPEVAYRVNRADAGSAAFVSQLKAAAAAIKVTPAFVAPVATAPETVVIATVKGK